MDGGILCNILPESSEFYVPSGKYSTEKCDLNYFNCLHDNIKPISLIIPTYLNSSLKNKSLKHVLGSIENSLAIQEVLIIVPECDKENYLFLTEITNKNVKIITIHTKNNRAKARNIGAQNSSCEFLLFLDDDMIVQNWKLIDKVLSYLIENQYELAAFPRRQYLNYPNIYLTNLDKMISKWVSRETSIVDQVYDPIKSKSPYKTILFCFPGCFMLIKKETFSILNGFNEEFNGWGLEDADFSLRVASKHRTLNLFNKFPPLLHIDHSVSPYKSEEHKENYSKFKKNYSSLNLDIFCDRIISGKDLIGKDVSSTNHHFPLLSIYETFGIRLDEQQIIKNFNLIINKRLEEGWENRPEWIILHGSRAMGTNKLDSDFDILIIFKGGILRKFFIPLVSCPEIEIEYSDIGKFEDIAYRYRAYPISAPLELSKIAKGRILWGNKDSWNEWSKKMLNSACEQGIIYWLLVTIGLELSNEKIGSLSKRYRKYLQELMINTDERKYEKEIGLLKEFNMVHLKEFLIQSLSNYDSNWKVKILQGKNLFDNQTPEICKALNWIMKEKY